jgi:hypothetical protein
MPEDLPRDEADEQRAWLAARRRTLALQLEACSPRASRYRVERIVALRRRRRELDSALRDSGAARS